jgi:hypothetical protein
MVIKLELDITIGLTIGRNMNLDGQNMQQILKWRGKDRKRTGRTSTTAARQGANGPEPSA